jgi:hypothetical protein
MVQTLPSKSVTLRAVVWLVEVFRSPCADRLLSVHLADLSEARAFSISPTSRCKAEAIIGLGQLILALLLSLFTGVRGRGILRRSDAPFGFWDFFTKVV